MPRKSLCLTVIHVKYNITIVVLGCNCWRGQRWQLGGLNEEPGRGFGSKGTGCCTPVSQRINYTDLRSKAVATKASGHEKMQGGESAGQAQHTATAAPVLRLRREHLACSLHLRSSDGQINLTCGRLRSRFV
jgi:hypothetical protein